MKGVHNTSSYGTFIILAVTSYALQAIAKSIMHGMLKGKNGANASATPGSFIPSFLNRAYITPVSIA